MKNMVFCGKKDLTTLAVKYPSHLASRSASLGVVAAKTFFLLSNAMKFALGVSVLCIDHVGPLQRVPRSAMKPEFSLAIKF